MRKSLRDEKCWVYFIQETMTQCIKIGSSVYPRQRINGLQAGNPYQLVYLGCVFGGSDLERELHRHFHKHRMMREWFSREIASSVKRYIAKNGNPAPAILLADYFEPTITIAQAASIGNIPKRELAALIKHYGVRLHNDKRTCDRADVQSVLGSLHWGGEINDESRAYLMGEPIKPIVQKALF